MLFLFTCLQVFFKEKLLLALSDHASVVCSPRGYPPAGQMGFRSLAALSSKCDNFLLKVMDEKLYGLKAKMSDENTPELSGHSDLY